MRFAFAAILLSLPLLAETKLGQRLTLSKPTSIGELMSSPDAQVGKVVQVKGKVTEVCQMAGCWMALTDPATGKSIRIKVNDGDIVFPKEAIGREAVAEGTLTKSELTREQALAKAKHEAEERKQAFHPERVKGPQVYYQIAGVGAVLE